MRLLLDTQILLWAATGSTRLGDVALELIEDEMNELLFSAVSVWEVGIKASLGRAGFDVDPRVFRRGLIDNGYVELPVTSAHGVEAASLDPHHRDPFDRMLVGQARVEGFTLVTADARLAAYGASVRFVG